MQRARVSMRIQLRGNPSLLEASALAPGLRFELVGADQWLMRGYQAGGVVLSILFGYQDLSLARIHNGLGSKSGDSVDVILR